MKKAPFLIYGMIILILFACQSNIDERDNNQQKALGIAKQGQNPIEKVDEMTAEEIAEHLVHLAERVPDVEKATAIVIGDLSIVGIDVNAKLKRSDVGVIKYEVAEALKKDPHGAYAFVSADPDINSRLKEMKKEIKEGHPISGIMNELAGIVGRLIPVVPGPEHKSSDPRPTKANSEKMNKGKEKELENIQEEQGKRKMEDEKNANNRKKREENEKKVQQQ